MRSMRRTFRRIHPRARRSPRKGSRGARGWRSSVWRWWGRRDLSQGQHRAQARGPEEKHPADEPTLKRAEATFENADTGEEASLEGGEARLELGSQFRFNLLQLRL